MVFIYVVDSVLTHEHIETLFRSRGTDKGESSHDEDSGTKYI